VAYNFPQDIERRVRAQIDGGQFETEDDVLREAMNILEKRQQGLRELRDKVCEADEDIAAGRVGPFDPSETKDAVRKRLESQGITG